MVKTVRKRTTLRLQKMNEVDSMTSVKTIDATRDRSRRRTTAHTAGFAAALVLLGGCASSAPVSTDTPAPSPATSTTAAAEVTREYHLAAPPQHCNSPGTETLSSVIRVATHSGSEASGVVIARNRILTAAHVVRDESDVLVYVQGVYRPAMVVARDRENDLALLMADTGALQPIRISQRHLLTAEPVWTVGYPLALELTTNFGRYQQHVDGAIHSSAGTNAGASGGGLLHCESGEYELAGMIRGYGAYWHAGELRRIEDLSISVPADTITSFAMSAGIGL